MSTDFDLLDRLAADVRAESVRKASGPDMSWIRSRAARRRRQRLGVQGLIAVLALGGLTGGGMWAASRSGGGTVVATDGTTVPDSGDLGRSGPRFQSPATTAADKAATCDRAQVTEGLDAGYVISDEQEITRLEELSGRYSGRPGVRAVVPTTDGRVKMVIDDEATPELVTEAENDGLEVVTSCVTAAYLRAAESILNSITVDGEHYITSGYLVFTDMMSLSTSLPEAEIRAALEQAGIPAERIDSVVTIESGQPGQLGRLSGDGVGDS